MAAGGYRALVGKPLPPPPWRDGEFPGEPLAAGSLQSLEDILRRPASMELPDPTAAAAAAAGASEKGQGEATGGIGEAVASTAEERYAASWQLDFDCNRASGVPSSSSLLFASFDTNRDGVVDRNEFEKGMERVQEAMAQGQPPPWRGEGGDADVRGSGGEVHHALDAYLRMTAGPRWRYSPERDPQISPCRSPPPPPASPYTSPPGSFAAGLDPPRPPTMADAVN